LYFFFDTLDISSMYQILRYLRLFLQPVYLTALDQLSCHNDNNALMCLLILLFSYYPNILLISFANILHNSSSGTSLCSMRTTKNPNSSSHGI
jgi:hypothetical protein